MPPANEGMQQMAAGQSGDHRPPQGPEPPLDEAALARLHSALVNHTGEGRTVLLPSGYIRYVNPAAEELVGWPEAELQQHNVFDLVHPDDLDDVMQRIAAIVEDPSRPQRSVFRIRGRDRAWRSLEGWAHNMLDQPDVGGIVVTTRSTLHIDELRTEGEIAADRLQAISHAIDDILLEVEYDAAGVARVNYVSNLERLVTRMGIDLAALAAGEPSGADLARALRDAIGTSASPSAQDVRDMILRGEDLDCELLVDLPAASPGWYWLRAATTRRPDGSVVVRAIATDITAQKETERSLLERTSQLRGLIEHIQAAIIVEDPAGRVTVINAAAAALAGCDPVGDAEADVPGALPAAADVLGRVAEGAGRSGRIAAAATANEPVLGVELERGDGGVLEQDYVPVLIDGAPIGYLWMFRDVTSQRRATRAIAEAHDQALMSSRLKSEFLAIMSHEVRTPLNGIIGMLELIDDGSLDEAKARMARLVTRSSLALLATIEDILDYSRAEAGRLQPEPVTFRLQQVVEEAVGLLAPVAASRGLDLRTELGEVGGWAWQGDATLLRQVLMNLVGNAVKYTEQGEVVVRACSPGGQGLRLEVADTGPGIDPAHVEYLFEPFSQVGLDAAARTGGTGLGLAITQRMVELMGGLVSVHARSPHGSTFRVDLPLSHGEPDGVEELEPLPPSVLRRYLPADHVEPLLGASDAGRSTLPEASRATTRVLVVEDNPTNANLALMQLQRLGLDGTWAAGGAEALEMLAREVPDLVLMDCSMPEMDGYEATRRIRTELGERAREVPIVAMTASVLDGERRRCLNAGMNDYLPKPVRLEDLRSAVTRWAGQQVGAAAIDREALRALVEDIGDATVVDAALRSFRDELPGRAGAIGAALVDGSPDAIVRAAHQLRSSALYFGAVPIQLLCSRLEQQFRGGDPGRASREQAAGELEVAVEQAMRELRDYLDGESEVGRHSPSR